MIQDLTQARQVAAQLTAGLLSRSDLSLSNDIEENAKFAATLFQMVLNEIRPPEGRTAVVDPLRM